MQNSAEGRAAPDQVQASLIASLDSFGALVSNYVFGSNAATTIEASTKQKRPSLVPAFLQKHRISYGPVSNTQALIQEPSDGEESEIDITHILKLGTPTSAQGASHPGSSTAASAV